MAFIKRRKVSASLTDFNANLSVLGAFRIMEDALTEYMGELKIDGLTAKRVYNAAWVFAKTKMKFIKNIEWNGEYAVTCFISKISNVTINIDVAVKNAQDELCVYSRTELCALDLQTGRIRKVSTVGVCGDITAKEPLTDISFSKIDAENLPVADEVKVKFTNIDFVGHTNNKEYVKFILDTYSVEQMKNFQISEVQIAYTNQSFEGDILTVHKGTQGDKDLFVIQKADKIIVKCEFLHRINCL